MNISCIFKSFVSCLDRKIVVEIENIIITFSGAFRKQFTDTFPFMFDHMFLIFAIAAFSLKLKTKISFKLKTKYTNKKILKCFYHFSFVFYENLVKYDTQSKQYFIYFYVFFEWPNDDDDMSI